MSVAQTSTWTSGARKHRWVEFNETDGCLRVNYGDIEVRIEPTPELGNLRWVVTVAQDGEQVWGKEFRSNDLGAAFGHLMDWNTPEWENYAKQHQVDRAVPSLFLRKARALCLIVPGGLEDGSIGFVLRLDSWISIAVERLLYR